MYLHAPCRSPFKGRSLGKNYNKEKPIKWGYTDYVMAESNIILIKEETKTRATLPVLLSLLSAPWCGNATSEKDI